MRIVFITGTLPDGGAERHAIGLLKALAARGQHDCHAVCVKAGPATATTLDLPPGATLRALDARTYLDGAAVADFAAQLEILKPQLIVAANPYALMYATLARARAHVPARLVTIFHSNRLLHARERLQMLAYRPMFWNAHCTVFLCNRQRAYWRRRAVLSRRNAVICNGVDTERFQPGAELPSAEEIRRALDWTPDDFVIGLPALLRPEKNHLQLVEAIRALRELGIAARALLIGDGEQRLAIEARVAQLGMNEHVAITGLQSDVRPWLSACNVVTLCSTTETFSLAALEAMAMARPVVLSNVGGATEMVVPGWNGLLFPARDTSAYVNCLLRLSDPASARVMGCNARHMVERQFSMSTMVDRYERLFAQLCDGPGMRRAPVRPMHGSPQARVPR